MIKKVILLLTLPTFVFLYLESCNKDCEHIETRNIISMYLENDQAYSDERNIVRMNFNYESYFTRNFQFNLVNKSYALTQIHNPCFDKLINPIDSVSIVSKNNFNSSFMANSEINSLFTDITLGSKMDKFKYDINIDNHYPSDRFITSFLLINDSIPRLDSIHDLSITIFCSNGDVFKDSVLGVNLKSKY